MALRSRIVRNGECASRILHVSFTGLQPHNLRTLWVPRWRASWLGRGGKGGCEHSRIWNDISFTVSFTEPSRIFTDCDIIASIYGFGQQIAKIYNFASRYPSRILHGSSRTAMFSHVVFFPSRFLHGPAWYAVITKVVKPFDVFLISPSRIWPWTLHGPSRTAVSEASVFFAIFVSKKVFLGRAFKNVFLWPFLPDLR